MGNEYFVYILASNRNGTIYTGVTSDLLKRVWEHKNKVVDGIKDAIVREKQMKRWKREWKLRLIEAKNLKWRDLYYDL